MTGYLRSIAIILCGMFFLAIGLTVSGADRGSPASKRYVFGVVPQFDPRRLYAAWDPVIKELEKSTRFEFKLVTTSDITKFEKELLEGGFDFVYANPYQAFKANKTRGYIPLVRDDAPLRGILVVRKDGPIRSVHNLNGKVVAFPSPVAFGASLLVQADLERLFHVSVTPLYVKSHSSVYLHVANGLTAAGGGVEKTLQEQGEDIRNSLRVIYTTRDTPSHPVAAHPRVPAEQREKVRKALLAMGNTPEGRELLSKIPVKRIISTSMDDYRIMRDWELERYGDPFLKEE